MLFIAVHQIQVLDVSGAAESRLYHVQQSKFSVDISCSHEMRCVVLRCIVLCFPLYSCPCLRPVKPVLFTVDLFPLLEIFIIYLEEASVLHDIGVYTPRNNSVFIVFHG